LWRRGQWKNHPLSAPRFNLGDPAGDLEFEAHQSRLKSSSIAMAGGRALLETFQSIKTLLARSQGSGAFNPVDNPALGRLCALAKIRGADEDMIADILTDLKCAKQTDFVTLESIHEKSHSLIRILVAQRQSASVGDLPLHDLKTIVKSGLESATNPQTIMVFDAQEADWLEEGRYCPRAMINLYGLMDDEGQFDEQGLEELIDIWSEALLILSLRSEAHNQRRPIRLIPNGFEDLILSQGLGLDSKEAQDLCLGYAAHFSAIVDKSLAKISLKYGAYPAFASEKNEHIHRLTQRLYKVTALTGSGTLKSQAMSALHEALTMAKTHGLASAGGSGIVDDAILTLKLGQSPLAFDKPSPFSDLIESNDGQIIRRLRPSVVEGAIRQKLPLRAITESLFGRRSFVDVPHLSEVTLRAKGLSDPEIDQLRAGLWVENNLACVFAPPYLDETVAKDLWGWQFSDENPHALSVFGLTQSQITEAESWIFGHTDRLKSLCPEAAQWLLGPTYQRHWHGVIETMFDAPHDYCLIADCDASHTDLLQLIEKAAQTGNRAIRIEMKPANMPHSALDEVDEAQISLAQKALNEGKKENTFPDLASKTIPKALFKSGQMAPIAPRLHLFKTSLKAAQKCPIGARAISKKRQSAVIRSIFTQANTKMVA